MRIPSLATILMVSLLLAAPLAARPAKVTDPDAPRSLPADGPVSVSWGDPSGFTELRYSGNRWQAERGNWVVQLAEYLRERAGKALPAGQRIEFTITDIKRAGDYEPWQGASAQDVRIVRDLYPPRMSFSFIRYGADGQVMDQGERKLVDISFLSRSSTARESDPLRHEKRMLDEWIRRELKADGRIGLR